MKIRNPINKRTLEQSSTHVHRGPAIGHAEVGEQAEQQPRQQAEGEPSSIVDCLTHLEGAVRDGFRVMNDRFNSIHESLAVVLPVSVTSDRAYCGEHGCKSTLYTQSIERPKEELRGWDVVSAWWTGSTTLNHKFLLEQQQRNR
ncbi:hypothetical protein AAC387_Pa05g2010 [Persea americana]